MLEYFNNDPFCDPTTYRLFQAYVKGTEAGATNRILEKRLQITRDACAPRKSREAFASKARVGNGGLITVHNAKAYE
jgi:hypothetical protein